MNEPSKTQRNGGECIDVEKPERRIDFYRWMHNVKFYLQQSKASSALFLRYILYMHTVSFRRGLHNSMGNRSSAGYVCVLWFVSIAWRCIYLPSHLCFISSSYERDWECWLERKKEEEETAGRKRAVNTCRLRLVMISQSHLAIIWLRRFFAIFWQSSKMLQNETNKILKGKYLDCRWKDQKHEQTLSET